MSPLWTSAEIVAATGGTANADFECNGVAFDDFGLFDRFEFARGGRQSIGERGERRSGQRTRRRPAYPRG